MLQWHDEGIMGGMIRWQDDRMAGWRDDRMTRGWDDWMTGWQDDRKLCRHLTIWYILTRTYPSNPLDCSRILIEPLGSLHIRWEEDEHDGEGSPAQGEGAHDDRHHGRDPEHGEGNQAVTLSFYLLCAACSLCNFFSTFVNFLLKVKVPFSNQVLLFFSISLISLISSSLNSWILTLLFSSKLDDVYKCNGRWWDAARFDV